MKKFVAFLLIFACVLGLLGCHEEPNIVSREVRFLIPAGSNQLIFDDEMMYFADGKVTISADYEGAGISSVGVWLANKDIEHAYEGNPYTNTFISPNSSVEVEVDSGAWYQIAVQMLPAPENDIPVVITVRYETADD